jgi:hypothetical protein
MKSHIIELEDTLFDFSLRIVHQRNRVGVVLCGAFSSINSEIAKNVSQPLQAKYINIAEGLLPQTIETDYSPTLGAYGPDDFIRYITDEANNPTTRFLFIDQLEPLLSTFGQNNVIIFFQKIIYAEPLKPIIIISYLQNQLEQARFPKDRTLILNVRSGG